MKFVIGIDEVGRGPLAGPVSICAVKMPQKNYRTLKKIANTDNLQDSKKLSEKNRIKWLRKINNLKKDNFLDYVYISRPVASIDKKGISVVIKEMIEIALKKLIVNTADIILLDGSLSAPKIYKNQNTIIKGDEKEPIISLASIVAKVKRDKYMIGLAKKIPEYGFGVHKGYGTLSHRRSIKKYGQSPAHRKSFCKNI